MSTHQISFAIQGMYCAKCAVKIETVLAQLDGIIAAQVNYATERATVVYEPARVQMAAMIDAVRSVGFDTALEHITLDVHNLIYASSAHTVERVLNRAEGAADVSADLPAGRVTVAALPEHASRDYFQVLLTRLGFPGAARSTPNSATGFVVRGLLVIGAAILLTIGALNHLRISAVAKELPSFWPSALAAFALFGAGYPFYRRAFAVFAQGEFDRSVLIALASSVAFFVGLVLALIFRDRQAVWSAWAAFVFATILTAGWFTARGLALWVLPHWHRTALSKTLPTMPVAQSQMTSEYVAHPAGLCHEPRMRVPGRGTQPDPIPGSVFSRH